MLVASQVKKPQLHKSHLGHLLSYYPDPDPDGETKWLYIGIVFVSVCNWIDINKTWTKGEESPHILLDLPSSDSDRPTLHSDTQ